MCNSAHTTDIGRRSALQCSVYRTAILNRLVQSAALSKIRLVFSSYAESFHPHFVSVILTQQNKFNDFSYRIS
jgi:hypothetical protein